MILAIKYTENEQNDYISNEKYLYIFYTGSSSSQIRINVLLENSKKERRKKEVKERRKKEVKERKKNKKKAEKQKAKRKNKIKRVTKRERKQGQSP